MKFKFKIQQYQTDAVECIARVFDGEPCIDKTLYRRDIGKVNSPMLRLENEEGYSNHELVQSEGNLLENIRQLQLENDIKKSEKLNKNLGLVNLDIEMETGTGKTYVYIKSMFELNKRYGWSKFVVVVPSIAIREGVAKSFEMLETHFFEHYGKKAKWFVYDSSNLQKIDSYSSDAGINVMIINTQAFASSMKEGANNKESKIIYSERDEFASRKPIDVLAANRPIIIMDEPQKMEGAATQAGLKRFNPLFTLYFSATHKTDHNLIYALDALDAYNKKLVKKIQVKGFEISNIPGIKDYMYLDDIVKSKNKAPIAKIEVNVKLKSGVITRKILSFVAGDKLETATGLQVYKGLEVLNIDPERSSVTFVNDVVLSKGQVVGDISEDAMKRAQIRETIKSHFEKEKFNFERGIKTLSLFFIDEVSKYKSYDDEGNEVKGEYQKIFEEEYDYYRNENSNLFNGKYQEYLDRFDAAQVHNGYFSIDKKGHAINSALKRGSDIADDISAYDLILKNKEQLLSFDEPTRFIFSHSALREGWDNPNVFQICTLRHASSATAKRQEVGRGLRLCVDINGNRMDLDSLGENIHEVNKLTVIANESYKDFVSGLQAETKEVLRTRPTKADEEFFIGKNVTVDGVKRPITKAEADAIHAYLLINDYIDDKGNVTEVYKIALKNGTLEPIKKASIAPMEADVHKLVQSIFDESIALDGMVEDGNQTEIKDNGLNKANFEKKEFQELWNQINHKYAYTVHYDSDELIKKVVDDINANLIVKKLSYTVQSGEQKDVNDFGDNQKTASEVVDIAAMSQTKYDLVGEIAKGATLTRKTVVAILKRIDASKFALFKSNPEEFISKVIKTIKEQKATMIVECIRYNTIDDTYDSTIFTNEKHSSTYERAIPANKSIMEYVFPDSNGEKEFAEALEKATEVCVYAKLPRSFQIPTPVGNYAPDWAIAFEKDKVKHVFFVAETKGSMDTMMLRPVEKAKIECAKKLFNEASTGNVHYAHVASYQDLLNAVRAG
ncbi:type III restriction enzyme [Fibrobacter sp. UWB15]|uniref:type III restriction-modification system endonuclease n=1 Tax=unclassified Fibrobacter TaxID=2634177 RepID=UPI0009116803|nr:MULTISPECIES: DEAD/DEAH box helicase family protein [unclassified Fibrobacter]PWJ62848.1 type III restriction enzyme [Fibrobacter sp. UWB6]SHG45442.1 type III restriction enzyme [Fibrobacter sp. UWB8]SMG39721.1 type III restriction enzyme [Fibrobacter sp. UWB15]